MNYDTIKKRYDAESRKLARQQAKVTALYKDLEAARRKLFVPCQCGHSTPVSEIELIHELSGGWRSDDDWVYSTDIYYWVCPGCTEVMNVPDETVFPNGFHLYVKTVLEWHSDRERCHGRILELLAPHRKREEEREKAERRALDLENARRVLREAGEVA